MRQRSKILIDSKKYPLLTRFEEMKFARQVHSKDLVKAKEAFDKLVLCNVGLVIKITQDFMGKGAPFEDLFQEGVMGLMKAVDHYKPTKGAKFSTYAAFWIKESMRRFTINARAVIRVPRKVPAQQYHYERLREEGKSEDEILKILGHGKDFLWELKSRNRFYSLDEELEDGKSLQDKLPAKEDDYDYEADKLMSVIVNSKHLSNVEKIVLIYRYGLMGNGERSQHEIAVCMGRSRERIRQIEVLAIDALRKELR